jgi:hypothetical protein
MAALRSWLDGGPHEVAQEQRATVGGFPPGAGKFTELREISFLFGRAIASPDDTLAVLEAGTHVERIGGWASNIKGISLPALRSMWGGPSFHRFALSRCHGGGQPVNQRRDRLHFLAAPRSSVALIGLERRGQRGRPTGVD